VAQIVDQAGYIVNSYSYDVWGNFENKVEGTSNPFTYFGQQYDESTGLYYLRGRYYDPKTGQFIQEDPARDGLNWYIYGNSNPILWIDPSGFITEKEIEMFKNHEISYGAYSYLMLQTYNYYLGIDGASDNAQAFRDSGYTDTGDSYWNSIIATKIDVDGPLLINISIADHFFRNKLNIEFSWSEMEILSSDKVPKNIRWDDNVAANLHQNHTDGGANIKYVSGDGHFEVIYNAKHIIQNKDNNSDDMGTYNYRSPSDWFGHYYKDVVPYNSWGNVSK
jgi:RHS repeat-associated protein